MAPGGGNLIPLLVHFAERRRGIVPIVVLGLTSVTGALHGGGGIAAGGSRCDMIGPQFDFGPDQLRALYGSKEGYVARLERRVDELVDDRWYLGVHGEEVLREAEAMPPF